MAENTFLFGTRSDDPAEQARRIALALAATQNKIAAIEAGICPLCQQSITLEKRGNVIYALPCGHRLYYGDLPPQAQPAQAV